MKRALLFGMVVLAGCGAGSQDSSYYPQYPPANQFVVECGATDEKAGQGQYRQLKGRTFSLIGEQEVFDAIQFSRLEITEMDEYVGREVWSGGTRVRVLSVERISIAKKNGIDVAQGVTSPRVYDLSYLVLQLERIDDKRVVFWGHGGLHNEGFFNNWQKIIDANFVAMSGSLP